MSAIFLLSIYNAWLVFSVGGAIDCPLTKPVPAAFPVLYMGLLVLRAVPEVIEFWVKNSEAFS